MNNSGATQKKVNWFARLFRKKVLLTYWLGDQAYSVEVCSFRQQSPDCIVFKDYYTKKNTMVRFNQPIVYVLEQQ